MTRNAATTVENNFVLGLITERTELRFPQNAATDIDNCVIDLYGRVSRRKGMDCETTYTDKTTIDTGGASVWYTEFIWEGVGGDSSRSLYVQQVGSKLYFYDTSSSVFINQNAFWDIDLTDHIPDGSPEDPSQYPCSYAVGNGNLFVANVGCEPFYVAYVSGRLEETDVNINIRDFRGLDDGLAVDERPSEDTFDDLEDDIPNHAYNIFNQGWYDWDALDGWFTAYDTAPSNADIPSLYKAQATNAFSSDIADVTFPGNTQAPKGHFILDAFVPDRITAFNNETGDFIDLPGADTPANPNSFLGNFSTTSDAFDGFYSADSDNSATFFGTQGFLGGKYTSKTKCASVILNFSWDVNYDKDLSITLRGSTSTTTPTDFVNNGVELATATVVHDRHNSPNPLTLISSDKTTLFGCIWVTIARSDGTTEFFAISEMSIYADLSDQVVFKRPSSVAFFNGRSFYAGTPAGSQSGLIYFSRIIETPFHYNQFYGDNDPTAQHFSDPLPSDGGYISIPDAGLITRLFATQTSLLVLATNGIWLIGGSGGNPFDASSYSVSKLSGIGSQCPQTVVDYKGTPVWWGDDGIYSVQFDPNFNSYTVVSLTQDSIKTYFNDIPATDRQTAKGLYDVENDIVYWLFADDSAPDGDANTYNKALVYVPRAKAYYPWTFPDSDFLIRGFYYVKDAIRSQIPIIKYTVVDKATKTSMVFAEIGSDSYKDWTDYSIQLADPTKEIDYTSYVAVGYYIHGETQRFFQGNYVFVFVDQDLQGSASLSTHYDWTTTANSGKWGTPQQIYPNWQDLQIINYRRLKTRGKGRAMQLYFESESGKPFSIIGWSIFETGNASI